MASPSSTRRRLPLHGSPYRPVLTHPLLRRLLPGLAVSYLGNGMCAVAVSWLALQLAPVGQRAVWVAVAVAAYTMPGAAGAALFGRLLRGRGGAQLAGWDATLRAAALGAVPLLAALGLLTPGRYVALLAVSSLLHAWGSAGRFTLLAEVLPQRHHLAANALLGTLVEAGTILGPLLAGLLVAHAGPAAVLAVNAGTFAVLAASYRFALPATARTHRPTPDASRSAGVRIILADRRLLGLLALTSGFFFLYGPVEVALPLHVVRDLHGSATVLAAYWTAFGVGAVVGGILAGHLGRWRLWPTTIGIVLGWGLTLLPLASGAPTWLALASFGLGGLIYAPYSAISMALLQRTVSVARLPAVLAARGAVVILSVPAGTALGGPLVALTTPRTTLLVSALATIALAIAAAVAVALHRLGSGRPEPDRPEPDHM